MKETHPISLKYLASHRLGVSEAVYIDIQNNKIADTSITVDKPVVDLGEFYFVDFSNMVSDSDSPTGKYPYVCGQYGMDRGIDITSKSLYYSINMQVYNPNVKDLETTTQLSENCATIDLRMYDDGSKVLVSDAVFTDVNCSVPITENNIVNKKYVDDRISVERTLINRVEAEAETKSLSRYRDACNKITTATQNLIGCPDYANSNDIKLELASVTAPDGNKYTGYTTTSSGYIHYKIGTTTTSAGGICLWTSTGTPLPMGWCGWIGGGSEERYSAAGMFYVESNMLITLQNVSCEVMHFVPFKK